MLAGSLGPELSEASPVHSCSALRGEPHYGQSDRIFEQKSRLPSGGSHVIDYMPKAPERRTLP